jgi:FkbM family methyltransferase
MKTFIQIGTNNGNDLFRKKVINEKPDLVLLVEPNHNLRDEIEEYYKGIPNYHIITKAIYYNDTSSVTLYVARNDGSLYKKNIPRNHQHFSLLPMNGWGTKDEMVKLETEGVTFATLCDTYGVTDIDYLQIDTEGFDSEIIDMIDFSKYTIKVLRFEVWGFDSSCFTTYHSDKCDRLGITGISRSIDKLTSLGYTFSEISDEDGCDIIATKS